MLSFMVSSELVYRNDWLFFKWSLLLMADKKHYIGKNGENSKGFISLFLEVHI